MQRESVECDVNMSDATSKRALMSALSPLQGLYDVTIVPVRVTRSNAANRFYWGVLCRLYAQYLTAVNGEGVDKDEAHVALGRRFRRRPIVNRETGEVVEMTVWRTSKMSKQEFGEYLDKCVEHLQQCGVTVPPPELYGVENTKGMVPA